MELTKEQVIDNIVDFMEQIAKEYFSGYEYVIYNDFDSDAIVFDIIEKTLIYKPKPFTFTKCNIYLHGMEYIDYEEIVVNTLVDDLKMFEMADYVQEYIFEKFYDMYSDAYDLLDDLGLLQETEIEFVKIENRIRNDFNSGKLYHKNKIKPKSDLKVKIEQYLDSVGLPKNEIELDNNDSGYFTLLAKNGFDLVVPIDKNSNISNSARETVLDFEPEKAFNDLWEHDYCREDGWTVKKVIDMLYDAKTEFDKKVLAK